MLDRLFGTRIHDALHFFGFLLIAVGMPSTKVLMSIGMLLLIANFLLEGHFREKIGRIRSNRLVILIIAFYLLLVIGLAWSIDLHAGLKDLKSRLPLLALPLIIAGRSPISVSKVTHLLHFFLASLLVTSLYNFLNYHQIIGNKVYDDIRGMSLFASHIRYGLLISLGVGISVYLQLRNGRFNIFYTVLAVWFGYYSLYSQILTGNLALMAVVAGTIFFLLWQWRWIAGAVFALLLILSSVYFLAQFITIYEEPVDCSTLPTHTSRGTEYMHSSEVYSEINGLPILTFYCEPELEEEWNKVSELDFMGKDRKLHPLRMTLARYMTALRLKKDADDFQKLTPSDIEKIENGYTYPNEQNEHFMSRIYGIKYQILNNKYPNGHSLLQRIEYWKTSVYLIRRHWLFGVGTGGNQKAFDKAYVELDSPLNPENRHRSHNMFFTYLISYGIAGLVLFVLLLFAIFRRAMLNRDLLALQFIIVLTASFLIEDTLETQLGVTIFGFFLALLVNGKSIVAPNNQSS